MGVATVREDELARRKMNNVSAMTVGGCGSGGSGACVGAGVGGCSKDPGDLRGEFAPVVPLEHFSPWTKEEQAEAVEAYEGCIFCHRSFEPDDGGGQYRRPVGGKKRESCKTATGGYEPVESEVVERSAYRSKMVRNAFVVGVERFPGLEPIRRISLALLGREVANEERRDANEDALSSAIAIHGPGRRIN
jgi:hypothetical protein